MNTFTLNDLKCKVYDEKEYEYDAQGIALFPLNTSLGRKMNTFSLCLEDSTLSS